MKLAFNTGYDWYVSDGFARIWNERFPEKALNEMHWPLHNYVAPPWDDQDFVSLLEELLEKYGPDFVNGYRSWFEIIKVPDGITDWMPYNNEGANDILYVLDGKMYSYLDNQWQYEEEDGE